MKDLYFVAILGLIMTLTFAACQNNADGNAETDDAILIWSGEYMVDGCGFEVEIDGKRFKPDNENEMDEAFKVEGETPVIITYEKLGRQLDIRCGLSTQSRAMDAIRVISVKKRT
ncbi:hypothetical protein [Pontibacter amylolyticus]|uniref:Copper resistance protein NlpE n=1 Tax=Pontibacter amylolyticus TaxID=1424080 RepID=A0ABQ1VW99_9BACT|nr:hypothetical protein [Pontibacter amylolyticus]GGG02552.1 hypothetical protein GCM10011323_04210 [Pontibacter amylolyticus]